MRATNVESVVSVGLGDHHLTCTVVLVLLLTSRTVDHMVTSFKRNAFIFLRFLGNNEREFESESGCPELGENCTVHVTVIASNFIYCFIYFLTKETKTRTVSGTTADNCIGQKIMYVSNVT